MEEKDCKLEVIDGLIQQCCKIKYSPYYTCQYYANTFVELCKDQQLQCQVLSIGCMEKEYAHSLNTIVIDGTLCIVEPQGRVISCDVGTPEKFQAAVCTAMGLPSPCNCKYTLSSSQEVGDYSSCSMSMPYGKISWSEKLAICNDCCDKQADGEYCKIFPQCSAWQQDCYASCHSMLNTYVCPKKNDDAVTPTCVKGYVPRTCDPKTCKQEYNTGFCMNPSGGPCKTIELTCENPAKNCENPSGPILLPNLKTCQQRCGNDIECLKGCPKITPITE